MSKKQTVSKQLNSDARFSELAEQDAETAAQAKLIIDKMSSKVTSVERCLYKSKQLHRIDEMKLNILLKEIPENIGRTLFDRKLKTARRRSFLSKKPLPLPVLNIVRSLGLLDESDFEKRAIMLIGFCVVQNYSFNTTKKYFHLCKLNGLFGNDPNAIKIRPLASKFTGNIHTRIISLDNWKSLLNYLHKNWSKFTAPLLLACYTGLRTMEILQFTSNTLYLLQKEYIYINDIKRKQTVHNAKGPIFWRPVYYSHFKLFLQRLIELYNEEYQALIRNNINVRLFNVTPKTLVNRFHTCYYKANHEKAPFGFGIHVCRNMNADLMAHHTKNLPAIQMFLQHKDPMTTNKYIRSEMDFAKDEFNRLTQDQLQPVLNTLKLHKN